MSETFDRALLDRAIVDLLTAVLPWPVGDNEIPTDEDDRELPAPFVVVYSFASGSPRGGPAFADPFADGMWTYQTTSVGINRDQAQAMSTHVFDVLCGRVGGTWKHGFAIPGWRVYWREQESTNGAESVGSLVNVADRYTFLTTPSAS